MKNKLNILWVGLVPLAWFLSFKFIVWIHNYPINWGEISGIGLFLALSGFFGTIVLIGGAFAAALYLQK